MSEESLKSGPESDAVGESPPLRAEVFILSDRECRSQITPLVPDELTVREFDCVAEFAEQASGNVALALISAERSDDRVDRAVRATLSASQHARIVLIAADGQTLLQNEVPHDDAFVLQKERDGLQTAIRHLYIRAYYSVTLDRYYKICLAIENHERHPREKRDNEQMQELRKTRSRVYGYLRRYRGFLDTEDFTAIATREDRFDDLIDSSRRQGNPSAVGLSDTCPDCGLDWTTWHGSRLKAGYERIGANTYRCTGCGHTLADNDPDNYRVG